MLFGWNYRRHCGLVLALAFCSPVSLFGADSKSGAGTSYSRGKWVVKWGPVRPVNGSPILLRVKSPAALKSLSASWLEHKLAFSFDAASKTWYALAGISLETKPGLHSLELSGVIASGKELAFRSSIFVARGKYRKVALSVPPHFTAPSAEEAQRIQQDEKLKSEAFAHSSSDRLWSGRFVSPSNARVSDTFGTVRAFNGVKRSVHQGIDYAVPQGTPVKAVNDGKVILAQPLFFEGDCVVLDHGQGLLTLYMHLSKIEVKEGDAVQRGEKLGLSGGTGRATGPHLHVAVRWQGVYLDPATLFSLSLPSSLLISMP
jgi:murein DD-endopeptidase MepM/ murein hydrolase activator NlpD